MQIIKEYALPAITQALLAGKGPFSLIFSMAYSGRFVVNRSMGG
jgi:hypothetical protein